jgi:hypothetical protein
MNRWFGRLLNAVGTMSITFTCASCVMAQDFPPPYQPPPAQQPISQQPPYPQPPYQPPAPVQPIAPAPEPMPQYSAPPYSAPQNSSRWPLRLDGPDGLITVYQPQLTAFDGNQLKARAAISVVAPGQQDPVFGAIWIESRVSTDRYARQVRIIDVNVTEARFPNGGGISPAALTNALRSYNTQQGSVTLSLDQLLEMLQVLQKEQAAVKDISTAPPQIIFVNHPAVLVQYDGQPKLMQVENSPLIRAVNTPFFVVLDPPTRLYYLKGAAMWYAAQNPLGPFAAAGQVPPEVAALAVSSGYQDPQPAQNVPAGPVSIVAVTQPSELVWTDGPEEMSTIPGTDLLYVTNTPSDLFLDIATQQIFVLLSGRWFVAPNHNGPWTFVPPDKLPPDFSRIPPNSEKGSVLAHVAGTAQARDAVADTYVPQTATIDRRNFEQPPVAYDGQPSFQVIEGTPVSYAVNTSASVLLVGGRYYCCHHAVWYTAGVPLGRWEICVSVPGEIYTIPPTCPVYSVRYCYVYESTPDLVYVGYLPGYVGCYAYDHVVVYGTGYYYQPYITERVYYARPFTFGFAARYDAYSGHWGFDVGRARIGGDAWLGARAWQGGSSGAWFGHGGYRPVVVHNEINIHQTNVTVNRTEVTRQSFNVYERRKDTIREAPVAHQPARTDEHIATPAHVAEPNRAQPAHTYNPPNRSREPNNVFAGPNGEVYRKTLDGWEQQDNGKWVNHNEPKTPAAREPAAHETPSHTTPSHETPAREPASPEPKAHETPREPAGKEGPAHEAEPKPKTPNRSSPPPELNNDYRARVAGQQRERNYPSASSSPRETPAAHETPREPQPSGHSGPSGGSTGQGSSGRQGENQRH